MCLPNTFKYADNIQYISGMSMQEVVIVLFMIGCGIYSNSLARGRSQHESLCCGENNRSRCVTGKLRKLNTTISEGRSVKDRIMSCPCAMNYTSMANGRHQCLVSEPPGRDLVESKDVRVVRAIIAQAVLALGDIHSDGAVHGGRS